MKTESPSTQASEERYRILLVDDEPSILRSLKRTLRRGGHEVLMAEGGAAGIEILETQPIHMIICDQRMPDVPGPEVLAKAYQLQPDAFRITLTGHTDLEAAQRSINDGHVNQFLMKPWDDEHLRKCVEDGLRSHHLVVENRRLQELTQTQNALLNEWNSKLEEKVKHRTSQLRERNEFLSKMSTALEASLRDTVNLLASMLEMASPSMGLHGKRVAAMTQQIGAWLKLDEKTLLELEFASRLHEIGFVGGENTNPKAASDLSHAAMRKGAEAGYRILSKIVGFRPIAEAVRDQAERFDGLGGRSRPDGEELSLVSRILAIADAYDSAVFNREDVTCVDYAAGMRALETGRHKRLDPKLCDLLINKINVESTDPKDRKTVEVSPRQITEGMILVNDLINTSGVLLIKAGTQINESLVHRVRHLSTDELLDTTIAVYAVSKSEPRKKAISRPDAA